MNRRKFISTAVCLVAALTLDVLVARAAVTAVPDRADGRYRAGETVTFTVTVTDGPKTNPVLRTSGEVTWSLNNYGPKEVARGTADLAKGNPFKVAGTLDRPDFLRVQVTDGRKTVTAGAAGFDLDKIRQSHPRPADFDAYWKGEIARYRREIKPDFTLKFDPTRTTKDHDVYIVSCATFGGERVWGFLSVPKDKADAPFGLHVTVPGAGEGFTRCRHWLAKGWIRLLMNVHLFEPRATDAEQQAEVDRVHAALATRLGLKNRHTYATMYAGLDVSREAYRPHDVMLGMNALVDAVAARPDVDRSRVVYTGSSQGGGFGLYLTYLNDHIGKALIEVPAITGLFGEEDGRCPTWPRHYQQFEGAAWRKAQAVLPYFDAANFAAGIDKPIRFLVGFRDECCPPANIYAGINACPSTDKVVVGLPGVCHLWGLYPEGQKTDERFLRELVNDNRRQ